MFRRLALLGPAAVYLLAAIALGDWVVDDAGISLAYARNLAAGHGFVAQPGQAPVEGFSNLLLVLLEALLFVARLPSPVLTAKVLGVVATLAAFASLRRTVVALTAREAVAQALLYALALTPPLVVWTVSGLENGLTVLLVSALLELLLLPRPQLPARAALLTGLFAMNRPDGLVFAPAVALLFAAEAVLARADREARLAALRKLATYVALDAAFTGALFAWRWRTFGRVWPHTYEAKREYANLGDHAAALVHAPREVFSKLHELALGTAGPLGPALFALLALLVSGLAVRGRLARPLVCTVLLALAAAAAFVFLERDWMGELRFGTAFVVLAWLTAVLVLEALTRQHPRAFLPFAAALVIASAADGFPRLLQFAEDPPTPYAKVQRETALLGRYADALGLRTGSVLAADVGAELLESPLRVYDLAGLCEPAIVRHLKQGSPLWRYEHPAFFEWVFEETRPTFVVTRGFWSNVTTFTDDPRFTRDYAAIDAYDDRYVARVYGRYARSGVFVRRDALGAPEALERLRRIAPEEPPRSLPIVRLARALGLRPPAERIAPPRSLDAAAVHAERLDETGAILEGREAWRALAERARAEKDDRIEATATERLQAADRTYAEDTRHKRGRTAAQLIDEGLEAYRRKAFEEAIAAWSQIAARDPLWPRAQNNIATAHIELKHFEAAEHHLRQALRAAPNDPLFKRNHAWLEQARDDH